MALVKTKPTSPGRRHVVKVVNQELHKGQPFAALLEKKNKHGGRNNNGHITTRHKGGGHKQHYRLVDFKRDKDGVPAVVERLEYDPNRSANIALLKYADGERRYILAPKGISAGAAISDHRPALGECFGQLPGCVGQDSGRQRYPGNRTEHDRPRWPAVYVVAEQQLGQRHH